jgi:hypothetical protein
MRADHLLILAGGKATRLGPLTANLSKALVPVGHQPVLARQITTMGIKSVTIVTHPSNRLSVASMLQRSGLNHLYDVHLVDQDFGTGPGAALETGLDCLSGRGFNNDSVTVLFADTLIDADEVPPPSNWVGVGHVKNDRAWCHLDEPHPNAKHFIEGVPRWQPATAFIGALGYATVVHGLWRVDRSNVHGAGERLMAPILNWSPTLDRVCFTSWLDVGDIKALAATRRRTFIARDNHQLELDERGVLTKYGVSEDERRYMTRLPESARPLFPRIFNDSPLALEYVDMPSLAELWLYWPGTTDMWQHIIETLITTLDKHLWPRLWSSATGIGSQKRAIKMYLLKPTQRLDELGLLTDHIADFLTLVDRELVRTAGQRRTVRMHGDLNFGNVLWSLSTDTFKLIDPRGAWGDDTGNGDIVYELAKLRYDYRDHFSAIVHGLYDDEQFGTEGREETVEVLDEVISRYADLRLVTMAEATLFLSAIPLHPEHQRDALMRQALKLIDEVMP